MAITERSDRPILDENQVSRQPSLGMIVAVGIGSAVVLETLDTTRRILLGERRRPLSKTDLFKTHGRDLLAAALEGTAQALRRHANDNS